MDIECVAVVLLNMFISSRCICTAVCALKIALFDNVYDYLIKRALFVCCCYVTDGVGNNCLQREQYT